MRIEYRILWIEDEQGWVDSIKHSIEDHLAESGLLLNLELEGSYKGDPDISRFDLIVVDCNLDDDQRGSEVIRELRDKERFSEILFYSKRDSIDDLRKELYDQKVDGVYCSDGETCADTVCKIIDLTLRKTQEINNLRGLVMAETAQIDDLVNQLLLHKGWGLKELELIHEKAKAKAQEHQSKLQDINLQDSDDREELLRWHLTSGPSFEALEKVLPADLWKDIKGYGAVIEGRNILAHCPEVSSTKDKIVLRGKNGEEVFTRERFVEIRKTIREYREKFQTALERLDQGAPADD